jgi:hypothetical protein
MTEKHPKRPRDPNQLAKSIIDIADGAGPGTPGERLYQASKGWRDQGRSRKS